MTKLEINYDEILGKEDPIITSSLVHGVTREEQNYHLYKNQEGVVALIGKQQAAFLFMADAPSLFNSDWCLRIYKHSDKVRDCSLETYRGTIGLLESLEGMPLELKGFTGNGFSQTLDENRRIMNSPRGIKKQIIHASKKTISTPEGLTKLICFDSGKEAVTTSKTQAQIQTIFEKAYSTPPFNSEVPDSYRSLAEYVFCRNYLTVLSCLRLFERKNMQGVFRYVAR